MQSGGHPLADNKHRAWRFTGYFLTVAAEQGAFETAVPARAHHDEIAFAGIGHIEDGLGDGALDHLQVDPGGNTTDAILGLLKDLLRLCLASG